MVSSCYNNENILLLILLAVPSSAPENIQSYAVDSTSIYITWSPPLAEFQNGMIRRYLICVTEIETGNTFNYSTSLTSYVLHSLHPYYNYEIKVAAETIAPGPFSTPVIVQTLTDGKVCVCACMCVCVHVRVCVCVHM